MSRFFEQLGVRADLLDLPLIHHHDLVCGQNRGKPMGDGDHGASRGQFFECHLDLFFRFGIERRGRLIEQEDGCVPQKCACDCESLLLAAGEQTALVADYSFVAARLRHDEVVRVGSLRRGVNFLRRRVRPAKLDVPENRVVK